MHGLSLWRRRFCRVVLLTDTDYSGSSSVAQLIRQEVERLQYRFDGLVVDFTVSFSIATSIPDDELGATKELQQADDALYQVRRNGLNRVEVN
jgi:PleD family two-component response regulator